MDADDKLRRYIIMSLICDLNLDIAECNHHFGIDFSSQFAEELSRLAELERDGLLEINSEELRIAEHGRPFLRNICMPFDAYLGQHGGDQSPPRFSATL